MKYSAAIVLALWILVVAPTLCMAGVFPHACDSEAVTCTECHEQAGHTPHDCHDDPCPRPVTRLSRDGAELVRAILDQANVSVDPACACLSASFDPLNIEAFWHSTADEVLADRPSVGAVLPLLI